MKLTAKLLLLSSVIIALISIPFVVAGNDVELWSRAVLSMASTPTAIVVAVVALLVLDIVLPIPSSLVCIAAFALLDPLVAFLTVCLGLTLSYFAGHILGATLNNAARDRVFTAQEFQILASLKFSNRVAAIVLSRPLPVLAEATAIYLGAVGTPLLPATFVAMLSNLGLAAMYWWIARTAQSQESLWLALLATMTLPAVFWAASKLVRRSPQSHVCKPSS